MFRFITRVRAARGARVLDGLRPDWYTRINLGSLDVGHNRRCILGQLSGHDYLIGLHRIGMGAYEAIRYGFICGYAGLFGLDHTYYRALTEAWSKEIVKRRIDHVTRDANDHVDRIIRQVDKHTDDILAGHVPAQR